MTDTLIPIVLDSSKSSAEKTKDEATASSTTTHVNAANGQFETEMKIYPVHNDILIPVMGRSGAGKSTFINRVLEGEYGQNLKPEQFMKTEVTLKRCTTVVGEAALKADSKERRIILVDTPGFDGDDNDFDANHNPVSTVANWLKDVYSRPNSVLAGIIYLHDISSNSLIDDGSSLQILRAICGAQNFDRIVIGTTKWDKEAANDVLGVRANQVRLFFQIVKGAKFGRKESTAKDIVTLALEGFSSSANLQIQLEMVRDQKAFSGTAAGVYYNTQQLKNIAKTLPLTSNKEIREKLERRKKELEKSLKSAGKTDSFPQVIFQRLYRRLGNLLNF